MVTDEALLVRILAEEPLGDDVGNVVASNSNLFEAILHPSQWLGDELKPRIVEERLLHSGDESEAGPFADFPQLAQEREVEDERLIASGAEILEQLVDHEHKSLVGMDGLKRRHHLDESRLVFVTLARRREFKRNPQP